MTETRWFDAAAIALAIAVMTGLALVPGSTDATTPAEARSAVQVDRLETAADARPSVLFIGDSYTAGSGLPEMSYACMAAVRMGWLCNLSAVPGTGYISGGPANRSVVDEYIGESTSFAERIPHLAARYDPDTVILDGGRNDRFPPSEDVFDAMISTIEDVRRTWPAAMIIFVRPRFLANPRDDLGFGDAFIGRLESNPVARGVLFLDPITGFAGTNTSSLLSDGTHPNPRGEQRLSVAMVSSLNANGVAAAS